MRVFRPVKIAMPEPMMASVIIRPFWVRKVNSKKLRANGIRKTAAMIPMIVSRRLARSGFSGFEIQ